MLNFVLFLPGIGCLFWLTLYLMMSPADSRAYCFAKYAFLVQGLFCLVATAPLTGTGGLGPFSAVLEHSLGLLVIPVSISYLHSLTGDKSGVLLKVCYLLPLILAVAECVTVFIIGLDGSSFLLDGIGSGMLSASDAESRSQFLLFACQKFALSGFMVLEYLYFITLTSVYMFSKKLSVFSETCHFFTGRKADLRSVQSTHLVLVLTLNVILLLLGRPCAVSLRWPVPVICLILTIVISLFAVVGSADSNLQCSFGDILQTLRFRMPDVQESDVRMHADAVSKSSVYYDISNSSDRTVVHDTDNEADLDISIRFERFMLQERAFLNPEITLDDVAERLGVGRDVVSDMMDDVFGISFSVYLNMLRIDYAEQYILNNDNVTQKDIARACGYSSAASFNVAFTRQIGVTPKIWKDRYAEMQQRKDTQY